MLKFIPVRGRKLGCDDGVRLLEVVEIYPREGTETIMSARRLGWRTLKFIPVRGRKLLYSFTFSGRSVEIYPREGTETTQLYNQLHNWGLKFIPVRGRKQIISNHHLKSPAVEIYPREGTETIAC